MKLLHDIMLFPDAQREVLEREFGIFSAEAFFEHAIRNGRGVQKSLKVTAAQLDALVQQVEGYLTPDFVKRCRQPVTKHGRGVIVD